MNYNQTYGGATGVVLAIPTGERQQLSSYAVGTTLWRVTLSHLSKYDFNWGYGLSTHAVTPPDEKPQSIAPIDDPICKSGSIIECENQVLGEDIPLVGSPYSLHYSSAAQQGYRPLITIPVVGPTPIPTAANLLYVDVRATVAGELAEWKFLPVDLYPNQRINWAWDRKDGNGNPVQGTQMAHAIISYVYGAVTTDYTEDFSNFGGGPGAGARTSREIVLSKAYDLRVGSFDTKPLGLGGWTISPNHVLEPITGNLWKGDGTRQSPSQQEGVLSTVFYNIGAGINQIQIGPSGTIYFYGVANGTTGIFQVDSTGTTGTILAQCASGGRTVTTTPTPAVNLCLVPQAFRLAPDGYFYFIDDNGVNSRILKMSSVSPYNVSLVAGPSIPPYGGPALVNDGPALAASFYDATDLSVGNDGSIFVADRGNRRIRKIRPDGTVQTVAGACATGCTGDGGFAVNAQGGSGSNSFFQNMSGIEAGPDGSIYFAEILTNSVQQITPDGLMHLFTGAGGQYNQNNLGDGAAAVLATPIYPERISIGGGDVVISGPGTSALRRIDSAGIISTLAGGTGLTNKSDGIPATNVQIVPLHATFGPDGAWYFADNASSSIRRIVPGFDPSTSTATLVPATDGSEIYQFDVTSHRHVATLTPSRGQAVASFAYDTGGRLSSITDGSSNVTAIDYTHAGVAGAGGYAGGYVTITVKPHGYTASAWHATTLGLDANGYLAAVANPKGETTNLSLSSSGLLQQLTDAKGFVHHFTFDLNGYLLNDKNALPFTAGTALARLIGYHYDGSGNLLFAPNTTQSGLTSPEGWTTQHLVDRTPGTGLSSLRTELRTHTNPLGLVTTDARYSDGSQILTLPDGTTITKNTAPDPRFGNNAPYTTKVQTVSGSQNITETMSRVICPGGDPSCPGSSTIFGITSQTDTKSIVGITGTYKRTFDASASTVTTQTPEGRMVVATLDNLDRITKIHMPGSLPGTRPTACTVGADDICDINISYDGTGRVHTVSQGTAGRTTTINRNYGSTDFVGSISSPFGSTQYTSRDTVGRPLAWTLPGSLSLHSTFDSNGNLASFTLPKNNQHQFTANGADLLASYLPPQVSPALNPKDTSYTYDRDSLLQQLMEPSTGDASVNYTYDAGTRLHGYSHDWANVTMGYDPGTGQLTSVNDSTTNRVNLGYQYSGSLPTQETYTGNGSAAKMSTYVSYKYDSLGRLTDRNIGALAGSGAQNISLGYDNDNVLKTVTATDPIAHSLVTYTVNRAATNGVISGATFGNIVEAYTYNEYGEVLTYSAKDTTGALTYYSVTYGRDVATGRITSKTEVSCPKTGTCSGSNLISKMWSVLGYDAKNRLGTITSTPQTEGNWSPTYDDDGNINSTYTYDAQDRITTGQGFTFSYDNNGDTAYAAASWGNFTYTYDPLGNLRTWLSSANGSFDYVFDGLNRRVAKIAHVGGAFQQGFLYSGDRVIARLIPGVPVATVEGQYVYATKENVPDIMVNAAGVYRIISDNVGNPRVIVKSDGTVLENIFFTAWGVPTPYTPTSMPFGFAGGLWDADLGLVRFGARDYGPNWGRWWSKDPIRMSGGYDLYAYCGDDPINCIDPSGLAPFVDRYGTPDAAALAGLMDIAALPVPLRNHSEWGGAIFRNDDGSYSYTYLMPGSANKINLQGALDQCPATAIPAGLFHSHLLGHLHGPSDVDISSARYGQFIYGDWATFLSGPSGELIRYDRNGTVYAIPDEFPYFEIDGF